ncbi:MAG: hypothetical protein ACI8Z5_001257 [Lentimonas sp.]|jgi:hypothetical protein
MSVVRIVEQGICISASAGIDDFQAGHVCLFQLLHFIDASLDRDADTDGAGCVSHDVLLALMGDGGQRQHLLGRVLWFGDDGGFRETDNASGHDFNVISSTLHSIVHDLFGGLLTQG